MKFHLPHTFGFPSRTTVGRQGGTAGQGRSADSYRGSRTRSRPAAPTSAALRSVPPRCHRHLPALPCGLRTGRPSRLALARPTAPAARTRTHRRPPLPPQPDRRGLRSHSPAPRYPPGSGRSSTRTEEQRGGGKAACAPWRAEAARRRQPGLRRKMDPRGGRRLWARRGEMMSNKVASE